MRRTSYTAENSSKSMRAELVATTVLVVLVIISAPVAAQEVNEEESNLIIDVILPLSLAFIMFSLGLGLTLGDFTLVFREPKAFGIGLTNQMIVLPIVGFGIATLADLDGELAVGIMILACCPGGVTSNILTKLAKGDTALSISYTAVVSVVTVITLPLIIGFSMDHFEVVGDDFNIVELGLQVFLLTTVPVIIGMLTREYRPNSSKSMENIVNAVATILFVIIVLAAIASEWDTLMENIGKLGPAVVALEVLMLTIGFQSARILDLESVRATTVSIESGIQNATVGITVGGLVLASPDGGLSTLSLPSGVYGALMYLVIAPFMYWRMTTQES